MKTRKLVSIIICLVLFSFSLSACGTSSETSKNEELTKTDLKYIDTVYNKIDNWDTKIRDGADYYSVDKIAFYDFDGTNRMCFFILYPVTDIYGNGFFIDQDGNMDVMKFDAGSNDKTIFWGWLSRTRALGINWNSKATKEEKLETLKTAYKNFKETNIYKK